MADALITRDHPIEGEDYTFNGMPSGPGAWITIGGFSVYLKLSDEGVIIDVYAKGEEDGEAIESIQLWDNP